MAVPFWSEADRLVVVVTSLHGLRFVGPLVVEGSVLAVAGQLLAGVAVGPGIGLALAEQLVPGVAGPWLDSG